MAALQVVSYEELQKKRELLDQAIVVTHNPSTKIWSELTSEEVVGVSAGAVGAFLDSQGIPSAPFFQHVFLLLDKNDTFVADYRKRFPEQSLAMALVHHGALAGYMLEMEDVPSFTASFEDKFTWVVKNRHTGELGALLDAVENGEDTLSDVKTVVERTELALSDPKAAEVERESKKPVSKKPQVTPETPSATPGTPSATSGKPQVTPGTPSVTSGKPQVTSGKPQVTSGKPQDLLTRIKASLDKKHAGLENCGNTCYLNSALQMLSYVPEFVEELKNSTDEKRKTFYSLFEDLYRSNRSNNTVNPESKLEIFNDIFSNLKNQQDVQEFMLGIFNTFNMTVDYFNFTERSTITCSNNNTSDKYGILNMLHLEISGKDIGESITHNEFPTNIEEDLEVCGENGMKGKALFKSLSHFMNDSNKYILIHLKRFDFTEYIPIKIKKSVEINQVIDLYPMAQIHPDKKANNKMSRDYSFPDLKYELYGSILHTGDTPSSGHYRFLRTLDKSNGILYNDSLVTEIPDYRNDTNIELNQNSYVLIYKRVEEPQQFLDLSQYPNGKLVSSPTTPTSTTTLKSQTSPTPSITPKSQTPPTPPPLSAPQKGGQLLHIYWTRHGYSCANLLKDLGHPVSRGSLAANASLCDLGIQQGLQWGPTILEKTGRTTFDLVGASALLRAQQTAALLYKPETIHVLPYISEKRSRLALGMNKDNEPEVSEVTFKKFRDFVQKTNKIFGSTITSDLAYTFGLSGLSFQEGSKVKPDLGLIVGHVLQQLPAEKRAAEELHVAIVAHQHLLKALGVTKESVPNCAVVKGTYEIQEGKIVRIIGYEQLFPAVVGQTLQVSLGKDNAATKITFYENGKLRKDVGEQVRTWIERGLTEEEKDNREKAVAGTCLDMLEDPKKLLYRKAFTRKVGVGKRVGNWTRRVGTMLVPSINYDIDTSGNFFGLDKVQECLTSTVPLPYESFEENYERALVLYKAIRDKVPVDLDKKALDPAEKEAFLKLWRSVLNNTEDGDLVKATFEGVLNITPYSVDDEVDLNKKAMLFFAQGKPIKAHGCRKLGNPFQGPIARFINVVRDSPQDIRNISNYNIAMENCSIPIDVGKNVPYSLENICVNVVAQKLKKRFPFGPDPDTERTSDEILTLHVALSPTDKINPHIQKPQGILVKAHAFKSKPFLLRFFEQDRILDISPQLAFLFFHEKLLDVPFLGNFVPFKTRSTDPRVKDQYDMAYFVLCHAIANPTQSPTNSTQSPSTFYAKTNSDKAVEMRRFLEAQPNKNFFDRADVRALLQWARDRTGSKSRILSFMTRGYGDVPSNTLLAHFKNPLDTQQVQQSRTNSGFLTRFTRRSLRNPKITQVPSVETQNKPGTLQEPKTEQNVTKKLKDIHTHIQNRIKEIENSRTDQRIKKQRVEAQKKRYLYVNKGVENLKNKKKSPEEILADLESQNLRFRVGEVSSALSAPLRP